MFACERQFSIRDYELRHIHGFNNEYFANINKASNDIEHTHTHTQNSQKYLVNNIMSIVNSLKGNSPEKSMQRKLIVSASHICTVLVVNGSTSRNY